MANTPIRIARDAKKLTQVKLAKLVGVSRETVARWESVGDNARQVDRRLVPRVAAILDMPAKAVRPDLAEMFE